MKIPLLDFGYIEFIEHWGSDERIIEAARMSTDKCFLGWGPHKPDCGECGGRSPDPEHCIRYGGPCTGPIVRGDEKLLQYLYEHKHSTPFEFAGVVIEVKAPIFVFREWHRHRTQSYSEMSARYTPLPNENYVQSVERLMMTSSANKQAATVKGSHELTLEAAELYRKKLQERYDEDEDFYQWALGIGVTKESARVKLPVGRYSRMRACTSLRNWMAFMTLRSAPTAQWEIQQYSLALGGILKELFPRTLELFEKEHPHAVDPKVLP